MMALRVRLLPAPGFAHDPKGFSGRDGKGHAVHGNDGAFILSDRDTKVPYLQDGICGHDRIRPSMPSPTIETLMPISRTVRPGTVDSHHWFRRKV